MISVDGTRSFNSQMLHKSIATSYNYTTHLIQWEIVVNRNRLPLNDVTVSDTLPGGMNLFIDETHPFKVTPATGAWTGSHNAADGGTAFTVTLPSSTSEQYTITFWAKLSDETLMNTKTGLNGEPLSGGSFNLTGTDYLGTEMDQTEPADSDGIVTFTGLQIGIYTIIELVPPDGYLMPAVPEILTVAVEYNENCSGLMATISSTAEEAPEAESYANIKGLGEIFFAKVDSRDETVSLSGGRFRLTGVDYAGNAVIMTATSVDGIVTFTDVPIDDGDGYIIKEIAPPAGYRLNRTDELTASVQYNSDKTAVETSISPEKLTNRRASGGGGGGEEPGLASIVIIKTGEKGERLAGAEFTLSDASDTVIVKARTGKSGRVVFDGLDPGTYMVKETAAPDGYRQYLESLTVVIGAVSETLSFTLQNSKSADDAPEGPGWVGENGVQDNGDDGGVLPKTGGIAPSFYILLAGLCLLLAGLVFAFTRPKGKH